MRSSETLERQIQALRKEEFWGLINFFSSEIKDNVPMILGDIFKATNAHGEEFTIIGMYYPHNSYSGINRMATNIIHMALDAKGKFIGFRQCQIDLSSDGTYFSEGEIITARPGVARVLEAAHRHTMQRVSNTLCYKVLYHIRDANKYDLEDAEITANRFPKSSIHRARLVDQQRQRIRWEALWGQECDIIFSPSQVENGIKYDGLPILLPKQHGFRIDITADGDRRQAVVTDYSEVLNSKREYNYRGVVLEKLRYP